mmetsp:Transcript_15017/g.26503  ORF Transcript_15017/g.26503 Transcript_15017/m.26503 type:complete len:377 (-) Transcript_15017:111-1241(-)
MTNACTRVRPVPQTQQKTPQSLVVSRAPLSERVVNATQNSSHRRRSNATPREMFTLGSSLPCSPLPGKDAAVIHQPVRRRPQSAGDARGAGIQAVVLCQKRPRSAEKMPPPLARRSSRSSSQKVRALNAVNALVAISGTGTNAVESSKQARGRMEEGLNAAVGWGPAQGASDLSVRIAGAQWLQNLERRLARALPVGAPSRSESACATPRRADPGSARVPVPPPEPRSFRPGSATRGRRPQSAGRQPPAVVAAEDASERRNRAKMWHKEQQELVIVAQEKNMVPRAWYRHKSRDYGTGIVQNTERHFILADAKDTAADAAELLSDETTASCESSEENDVDVYHVQISPPVVCRENRPRRRTNTLDVSPATSVDFDD